MDYGDATAALLDVRVVSLEDGTVEEGRMIVLAGDTIRAVVVSDPGALPEGAHLIDGAGAYALPGLWDAHVHAFADPDDAVDRVLPLFVAHGVTSVRDMGANLGKLRAARARLAAEPERVAPRIVASGPLLNGRRLPWYGDVQFVLETPEEVRETLPRLAEAGVDFFKVYDGLNADVYSEITAVADSLDLPFAGHVPGSVGLRGVAGAGQRTVEHLGIPALESCANGRIPWFDRSIEAKFQEGYDAYYALMLEFWDAVDWERCLTAFHQLAADGGYFTPTLGMEVNDAGRIGADAPTRMSEGGRGWCETSLAAIAAADPELRERAYASFAAALTRIQESGVPLLAGSDTPNGCLSPGASLIQELERLVEAGLTPLQALRSATILPAEAFALGDRHGALAAGRAADVVLVARNPLDDIGALRFPEGVVIGGRWLDRTALEAIRRR